MTERRVEAERYVELVHAYLRDGQESNLAAIGALRDSMVEDDAPIEDLVGMHERALLTFEDSLSPGNFHEFVTRTSTCLTELVIAYSLADQKKKSVRERDQRVERERQRLVSLGQMAGGVAHEFNNLLQPIMGMAEMAIEDAEPGGELAGQLDVILGCARQAATIVRGILTTGREHGPAPRPVPFAPLLRTCSKFLAAVLPHGVLVELAVGCGDDCVLCEDGELGQVLLNLARNAGDSMDGEGRVRIALERLDRQRFDDMTGRLAISPCLRLVVADDGVGMAPEVAAQAFQPFYTTKGPDGGTGLGLSVVMAIVHGWGGTLDVDTAPGAGTRVSIILPIVEDAAAGRIGVGA
ncbi:MAG: ATP-binding protein [Roseiarcus sp.]